MKRLLIAANILLSLTVVGQSTLPVFVEITSGSGTHLRSVNFANAQTGYAAGDFLTLLKTTDGGFTWNQIPMNGIQAAGFEDDKVIDLHFFDAQHGYCIVEFYSAMFETTDGGANWTGLTDTPGNLCSPDDFAYVSESLQVLVGKACFGGATLARRVDTWEEPAMMLEGDQSKLVGISFFNENIGAVVSDSGKVYTTTNGGETWNGTTLITTGQLTSVTFANENSIYIAASGAAAGLYVSNNGGTSWTAEPTLPGNSVLDLNGFLSGNVEVAFGQNSESGLGILAYRNSGDTEWMVENYPAPLNAGYTLPDGNIVVAGNGGRIVRSDFTSSVVERRNTESRWNFYPNPARDLIFIDGDALQGASVAWKLMDASGRIATSGISTSGVIQFNSVNSGFYLIELISDGNSLGVRKVVIN